MNIFHRTVKFSVKFKEFKMRLNTYGKFSISKLNISSFSSSVVVIFFSPFPFEKLHLSGRRR